MWSYFVTVAVAVALPLLCVIALRNCCAVVVEVVLPNDSPLPFAAALQLLFCLLFHSLLVAASLLLFAVCHC